MKNTGKFISFILGAAAGSAVTFAIVNKKYKQMYEEDVKSVKEAFKGKKPEAEETSNDISETKESEEKPVEDKVDYSKYTEIVDEEGYGKLEHVPMGDQSAKPVVLEDPAEFGDNEEYRVYSLYSYTDGVVADDNDEPLEDVEGTIGDAVNHFGDYEDDPDSVYVRNDAKRAYYEVLLCAKPFSDIRR